ncbi:hypothetical protein M514_08570 [Trichuris suis]|uniref:RNA-directed DNA polymerase n=1 Tax=Trichuris suis TaxID=68888 RepID=A0A085N1X9_9BILA|nr:hypothetical protein M514_08570 [Trichuris suis]
MVQQSAGSDPLEVDKVAAERNSRSTFTQCDRSPDKQPTRKPKTPCWLCGAWHYTRFCSYKSHLCSRYGDVGHKEGFCPPAKTLPSSKRKVSLRKKFQHRGAKTTPRVSSTYELSSVSSNVYRRHISVNIEKKAVIFQIDTGSDLTIISVQTWKQLGSPPLSDTSSVRATTYSGDTIPLRGSFRCAYSFGTHSVSGTCYVSDISSHNLLGAEWIFKLGLYDQPLNSLQSSLHPEDERALIGSSEIHALSALNAREYVHRRYPEICSDSLGHCKFAKASLRLRPDAQPVFRPKRPVPYAVVPLVEAELDRLEKLGVISKVNYSAWAAPLVAVRKRDGRLRLCADFSTGLNDALEMHQYPPPTPEDIFSTLNGGTVFSQIDFSDAYLQIEVSEESKELVTLNTHRGLYRYNRLPFGVKSAPGIFQQIMDTLIAGLHGVVAYLDDVIVVGKTEEDHKRNLDALLQRIPEWGFHIRLCKCQFAMPEVNYLGCIVSKNGRLPDPNRTAAITRMPVPTNVSQLRSFLGMVNHYGQFIRNLCDVRAPLDRLLRKDARFEWTPRCQQAFDQVISIITSDLLLAHYDPRQEIIVAADASSNGLGAVISHRYADGSEKAISHASRTLTSAEKHYSQIEKEALALIFALQKFHKMIHGRKFTLLTDHKPLLAIFGSKSGIPVYTASRLQRWATIALAYNFIVHYRRTSSFGQGDALSRFIASQPKDEEVGIAVVEAEVQQVLRESIRALPVTAGLIAEETAKDWLLQRVIKSLRSNWPRHCYSPEFKKFFDRKSSLSFVDDCLMYGERVIIPSTLQRRVLRQVHEGHPGVSRMKAIARSHAYWPKIDSDIENVVRSCQRCAEAAKAPIKTELCPWPKAPRPWARVHIDYAGPFFGHHFLVIVDSYSKWPEILMTDQTTARVTVRLLKEVFSRFGMPEVIVTDNGTQFSSAKFQEMCDANGIQHLKSPPFHPQSNGQAERFEDTFKRALHKMKGRNETIEDLQTFLLAYRSTPNPTTNNVSPAEALFGRPLRTSLSLLRPSRHPVGSERDRAMQEQFNRHHGAKKREFFPGESVIVRD